MAYSNNKKNQGKSKIRIELPPDMVDLMIEYSLSDSPLVNLRAIVNLKNLIDRIEFTDEVLDNRVKFDILKCILTNEVDKHIFQFPLLKAECMKMLPVQVDFVEAVIDEAALMVINENDIEYINQYVEERLSYLYLFENKDKLKSALESLELNDNLEQVNATFENVIGGLYRDLQNSKAVKKDSATDFCIGANGKNLVSMVKKTIDDMNKPSNHIKTGVKALNDMLGGGFESSRLYIAYAPPKSWKSGLLMNIGLWACKYNEFVPKDPDKVPCILYVTMENTSKETLNRMYQHITGRKINTTNMETATKVISEYVQGDKNVSFEIRYRSNRSMNVADLDSMVDELSLEGKEVVMIVQDYIKRIRSNTNNADPRLEYGDAANDLVSLARSRDIPVVTAMQINRVGMTKIETALKAGKGNLAKQFDKTDGGESNLILENTDYAFAINPEKDPTTGENFLGVKLWVSRVETENAKPFFLQPFENGMKLKEDYGTEDDLAVESINTKADFNPTTIAKAANMLRQGQVPKNVPELSDGEFTY